ncbi:MAG: hypothetical protein ABSF77_10565 [Spirochaetia bacterium]|jgi:hypothetical protein
MKIRKLLPLLAFAVVALFFLASCDRMLEAIYPGQTTPPPPPQSNQLIVDVSTYYSSVLTDIYYGPLTILLKRWDGVSSAGYQYYDQSKMWLSYQHYDEMLSSWTYNNLPDGYYIAYVWVDFNQDGTPYGDYDYGYYWPVSSSYLTGNYSTLIHEYVYYYGYNAKYITQ